MKRVLILGGGESGVGSAVLAQKLGYKVLVSDAGTLKEEHQKELEDRGIPYEMGGHVQALEFGASRVIKSPGISPKAAIVKELEAKGGRIIGEMEFAAPHTSAKLIGITGSNGKTTTTSLVYHILKQAGLNVGLGGNIGKSFARQVAEEQHDVYVLELSSFQLDDMFSVRLDVAVLTNITPDHLDRYNYELKNYMGSKMRITQNQTEADYFIYCADDPITQDALNLVEWKAQALPFSLEKKLHHGAWAENQEIIWKINEETNHMYRTELALRGKHNEYNSMAAGLVAKIFDIRQENLRESLSHFEGIEHRLEPVATVKGVDYINDSKATNVNSTWYALETMDKPVVWIVGGVDKGNDYEPLIPLVKDKVKAIVCLGEDVLKIHEAFRGCVETIINTGSMQEAVTMSSHFSSRGDVVLLSPCCASFDLFQNYEDRGRQFKFHVRNL